MHISQAALITIQEKMLHHQVWGDPKWVVRSLYTCLIQYIARFCMWCFWMAGHTKQASLSLWFLAENTQ